MSQFNAYVVDSHNVFDYLIQPHNQKSCVIFPFNQQPNILSNIALPDDYKLVASDVAWPCAIRRVVVTAPTIEPALFDQLCTLLQHKLTAALPIRSSVNYQSVELLVNDHIELAPLAAKLQEFDADINIIKQLPSLNKPGLVVLDMDSTSIQIECIDEIAKLAGVGDEVAQVTELAMQGKLDFAQSLCARVAKLKGVKLELLDVIARDLPLMPGMAVLSEQFQAKGWKVAIASGGFTYFADNLKALLNLDDAVSNVLEVSGGELTGKVVGRIVDAQVKAETVVALADKYGIEPSQTIAIGDGANDLVMMEKAALGIAYHAKPLVREQADIAINQGNLAAVIALLTR